MKIEYFAILREFTGKKAEEFDAQAVFLNTPSLIEVLDYICKKYPALKERLLKDDSTLHEHVKIVVNGKDARALDGLKTALKNEDEIAIFPAAGGG